MQNNKMNELKKQLAKKHYEYITIKDEVHIEIPQNNILLSIRFDEDYQEYFIYTFDSTNVLKFLIDDYRKIYFKKDVKAAINCIHKLVTQ
ncbi:hypothetical protein [Staphylococcus casei]|uniref:Uncharacterized protein n=1 Tax=Staphylococcus casei TaxID=201828 RepID=A0ABZ2W9Y3_9STAP